MRGVTFHASVETITNSSRRSEARTSDLKINDGTLWWNREPQSASHTVNLQKDKHTDGRTDGEVTNFVVHQCEPQFRLDDGISHQKVLHFLQFLFAFLCRRIILSPHWEVLENLQHAHCCSWKRREEGSPDIHRAVIQKKNGLDLSRIFMEHIGIISLFVFFCFFFKFNRLEIHLTTKSKGILINLEFHCACREREKEGWFLKLTLA